MAMILAAGLVTLAVAAASSGKPNSSLSRQERIDLAAQAQISTVRVAARACPGVIHGSGFVVDGLLFTSGHIAVHDQRLKVDRPGQSVESLVVATSTSLDVAVADAAGLIAVEMSLGPKPAREGESVFVAGFPDGRDLEMFEAKITRYGSASEWGVAGRRVMLLEPAIRAGFSGGPVMDRDGLVVGMLAGVDAVTGLAVAIPGDELGPVVSLAVETWASESGSGELTGSVAHSARACGS
ncbi:MAG: S1 family peptidase [Acidimicrobiales bacterium]